MQLGALLDVPAADGSSSTTHRLGLGLCMGPRWEGSFQLVLVPEDCADRCDPQACTLFAASQLQLTLCWQEEDISLAGGHGSL